MAVSSVNVLSLGPHAELDTNESTVGANNANLLVGKTFGSTATPLWSTRILMTINDGNNDATVPFTDKTPSATEFIQFGNPPGAARSVDAGVKYVAKITYWDGTTADAEVRILQDGTGNLYMLPPPRSATAAEVSALTQKPITSLSITSVAQNNFEALETSRFGLPGDPVFPCFVAGTRIHTETGEKLVQELQVGDSVYTVDHGYQPIRWIGSRRLTRDTLQHSEKMRPIRISAGSLGESLPTSDLLVSPQHRILVRSKIARRMRDADEVLVAAKHLCVIAGIARADDIMEVEYFHMLFDHHEVLLANGAETESLFVGAQALDDLGSESRNEILEIFPELADPDLDYIAARPIMAGRQSRQLAARHVQNHMPLI